MRLHPQAERAPLSATNTRSLAQAVRSVADLFTHVNRMPAAKVLADLTISQHTQQPGTCSSPHQKFEIIWSLCNLAHTARSQNADRLGMILADFRFGHTVCRGRPLTQPLDA